MKKRRVISAAFSLALAVQMAFPTQLFALFGGGPKIPSASQVAKELEQRYHINTQSVQNIGESFNVSDNKKVTPEVSIFFSPSDPKDGQKITAKAFPMYFSSENSQLYYTWYLKQKGCDLGSAIEKPSYCNADGAGGITVNDWKVAAARILATDGADKSAFDYSSTSKDSDGFNAEYGGGNKVNTSGDWCYLVDRSSGTMYELVTSATGDSFSCSSGYTPSCVSGSDAIASGTINYDPYSSTSSQVFSYSSTYENVGAPSCKDNAASCPSGTVPRCVLTSKVDSTFDYSTDTTAISCTSGSVPTGGTKCSFHLFPWPDTNGDGSIAGSEKDDSGDGAFLVDEENFWGTNPNDSDTADNGNKDEANVVGLGQDTFKWNYQAGDMLGVVVEGTSMISTKHDDSSSAIMWAFSKNDCPITGKKSYSETIKGYSVVIPTTSMTVDDVNACLEDNLIDPLEGGQGASKKLEVEVSATPENPTNDESSEGGGDTVSATVSVSNSSRSSSELLYDWTVSVSDNPTTGWHDVTNSLKSSGLLERSRGNGLHTISIALNMQTAFLKDPDGPGGSEPINLEEEDTLYLRIGSTVKENFSSSVERTGKSDVIVRVSNTTKKIVAYSTAAALLDGSYKVSYDVLICNDPFIPNPTTAADAMQNLNRIACRVMKNEIIGLKLSDESGLSDFHWTLNGLPITCSQNVSASCGKGIFFAVAGNSGETYTIKASAVDTMSGKSVTLARTFQIVEPEVLIESVDQTLVWPKYVGSHTDLDGNVFDKYSDIMFQTYGTTGRIKLKARFLPSFAGVLSSRYWTIDGEPVTESDPFEINYAPTVPKAFGEVYNVSFYATLVQPVEKRQALKEIWGIDTLASSEIRVSQPIQIEVLEAEEIAQGPKKFLAAISSYLPASVLFAFKMMLSMALLLFTVGFVFSLIPAEPRTDEVILSRRD